MAGVACGWRLSGITGTNPAQSQLQVLDAIRSGNAVALISPLSVGWLSDGGRGMRIQPARSDADDGTGVAWAPLEAVPAGTYAVRVVERRPRGGTLAFRIGRSAQPWRTFTLDRLSDQTITLPLPQARAC